MFEKILKFFKARYVKVVYTLGNSPKKEYKIGDRIILGAEGKDFITGKIMRYRVRNNKIYIPIPMFGMSEPFNLHPNGELSPAFKCKCKGIPVDYMFWIPEDY